MITVSEIRAKMTRLNLKSIDVSINGTLEEAEQMQAELQEEFNSVRLWGYPTYSNNGTYNWSVSD